MRKDLLMKELKKYGISDVPSWTGDQFEWTGNGPFFVKPISGRGSRGIRKINTPEQLHAYYILEKYSPADVLIQEYVDGEEYTVGALINPYGDLMAISTRKVLKKRGITIRAVTVNDKRIEEVVSQINEHLSPQGPINIQLFITRDGNIKIFEINPRFSTTTVMSYAAGLDEIGLWLKYAEKKYDGELFRPKEKIVLHRRWENVFYEQH
jgi:carbamoyl-phosphate synthase large subunit